MPYNKLHDRGYTSIGDVHSTAKVVADEEVPSLHGAPPCAAPHPAPASCESPENNVWCSM